MGTEIEHKYLVKSVDFLEGLKGKKIEQGYISNTTERSVRVRRKGAKAYLTIKGAAKGISRAEFEYEIPVEDAQALLADHCDGGIISKTRYEIEVAGKLWEVDVFEGDNIGLVVAEIELAREDEAFELPEWAGEQVSHDERYLNAYLSLHPYKTWGQDR